MRERHASLRLQRVGEPRAWRCRAASGAGWLGCGAQPHRIQHLERRRDAAVGLGEALGVDQRGAGQRRAAHELRGGAQPARWSRPCRAGRASAPAHRDRSTVIVSLSATGSAYPARCSSAAASPSSIDGDTRGLTPPSSFQLGLEQRGAQFDQRLPAEHRREQQPVRLAARGAAAPARRADRPPNAAPDC